MFATLTKILQCEIFTTDDEQPTKRNILWRSLEVNIIYFLYNTLIWLRNIYV